MLYYIIQPIVKIILLIYFRKIHIIGLDKIPKNKPLLIACNHPTGFVEPCIMASFFPMALYFMTRGDLFEKPLMGAFLRSTHQIPIFRFRDGFSSLRKNAENLNLAKNILNKNGAIMVFIEGSTSLGRKLRPFQKGLAKMAKEILNDNPESPLEVLPVIVNFTNANKFRSSMTVEVFDTIDPKNYKLNDAEISVKEIKRLNDDLYEKMKPGAFHLEDSATEKQYNSILEAFLYDRFPSFFPHYDFKADLKERGKRLAVSDFSGLNIETENKKYWLTNFNILERALVFLLAPIALIGYLLNFMPAILAKNITERKVKQKEFYSPVLVASSLAFYILYILIFIVLAIFVHSLFWYLLLLACISGYIWLYHLHLREKQQAQKDWNRLDEKQKKEVHAFRNKLI